jgi:lipopolysaccharide/colanic/teichoic acid biosynthesis glycosyltransferase
MATAAKSAPAPALHATQAQQHRHAQTHFQFRQSLHILADLCGIFSGAFLAITLRFPTAHAASGVTIAEHISLTILYAVLIVLFCHTQNLYSAAHPASFPSEFTAIAKSILFATLLLGTTLFLTGIKSTSRLIIAGTAVSALLTMTAWRQYRRHTLKRAVADGLSCHNVLIIGTDHLAQTVAQHLINHRHLGFLVVGHLAVGAKSGNGSEYPHPQPAESQTIPSGGFSVPVPDFAALPTETHLAPERNPHPLSTEHPLQRERNPGLARFPHHSATPDTELPQCGNSEPVPAVSLPGSQSNIQHRTAVSLSGNPAIPTPLLGTTQNLKTLIRTHFIDEVIICTHHRPAVLETIADASEFGVGVRVIPDLYDGLAWGARLDYLGDFPTLTVVHRPIPALALTIKRTLDIIGSALALAILSPLLLLLALIVKLDSKGPVLYASKRLGKKGRPFPCFKFRTMVADADLQKAKLQHLNERDSILFKIANDPRITRAGRFLRKHSLDELPQFWNVLRGDMSLVGPRPPLANEVTKYETGYFRRLDVAPGITGLWQVEARNNPSFDKYISLDLHYIENWSLGLDLQILFRTVAVVLAGTGS